MRGSFMREFYRSILFVTAFASLAVFVSGCQTARYKHFDGVQRGMTKAEVIDETGGPDRVVRMDGKDRWIYIFRDHPEGPLVREVHFDSGLAVYVGGQVFPKISAKEQDRINQASNEAEAKRLEEEESQSAALLGKARAGAPSTRSLTPEEQAIEKYIEDSLYGNSGVQLEKDKRAPVFVPVDGEE